MKYTIFEKPPADFHPDVEVASCYCEWNDRFLLVKRHPKKPQGETWGVPAGKLEQGETVREAVIREVQEEVGLDVAGNDLEEMGELYIRLPHVNYIYHMFRKRFTIFPKITLALEEHTESKWVTVSEALKMPLIVGGADALQYYVRFRQGHSHHETP